MTSIYLPKIKHGSYIYMVCTYNGRFVTYAVMHQIWCTKNLNNQIALRGLLFCEYLNTRTTADNLGSANYDIVYWFDKPPSNVENQSTYKYLVKPYWTMYGKK